MLRVLRYLLGSVTRQLSNRIMSKQPTGTELRKTALDMIASAVCRDRQNTYGDAEDNFAAIASLCNTLLRNKLRANLTPQDIAIIMSTVKLSRMVTSPDHLDNWIDLAGYAVCGAGITMRAQLLLTEGEIQDGCDNH